MFLFQRFSNYTAAQLASNLKMDRDQEEILAYGAYAILLTGWTIILISIFGLIFSVLLEALTISITADILRKYSGGVHATSPNRCAVIGTLVFIALGEAARLLSNTAGVPALVLSMALCFGFSYYCVLKLAPVDTPNKPIIKEEKKKSLKRKSLMALHIFLSAAVLSLAAYYLFNRNIIFYKLVFCFCLGIGWQSFTLTKAGHLFVSALDSSIRRMIQKIRR